MADGTTNLFDDIQRTYSGTKGETEPAFAFVNRSARPLFAKKRKLLQEWFEDITADGDDKKDLRARFRSNDEKPHQAALFELYCHAWLRQQGFVVKLHQSADKTTSRVPDFTAQRGAKLLFLESTLAADTFMDEKTQARLNSLLQGLSKLDSPHYGVIVDYDEGPEHQPSSRQARKFLRDKLQQLESQASAGSEAWPSGERIEWEYEEQDWKIRFSPVLRAPEDRGKSSQRLILSGITGGEVSPETSLIASIKRKATAYGDLANPYIVAVNTADQNTWDSDILDSFVGRVKYLVNRNTRALARARAPESGAAFRDPRGNPTNTRVSGVLVAYNLHTGNLATSETPELWHNPWARNPLDHALWQGPQVFIDPETLEYSKQPGFDYQDHVRTLLDY